MKEELTTAMHHELLSGEMVLEEMNCLSVLGVIRRGHTKAEALKMYEVSEVYYDEHIEALLKQPVNID